MTIIEKAKALAARAQRIPGVAITRRTLTKWSADQAPMMGASLAYYSLFSIVPLLLVALAIAGVIFGAEAARGQLEGQLEGYFGEGTARSIQGLLAASENKTTSGTIAFFVSIGVLLFGASSVFNQLKVALNRIWGVDQCARKGFIGLIINRLLAMGMVIMVGLLLLSSLFLSAIIGRVTAVATELVPIPLVLLQWVDLGIGLVILTLLFAAIFRLMPDADVPWRSVLLGALFTSALFGVGRYGINFYIARSATTSGFGAAGSIVVLLIWIYYSAQIFFLGAEFTYAHSHPEKPENCEKTIAPGPTR